MLLTSALLIFGHGIALHRFAKQIGDLFNADFHGVQISHTPVTDVLVFAG
jgi:hypothetical protein